MNQGEKRRLNNRLCYLKRKMRKYEVNHSDTEEDDLVETSSRLGDKEGETDFEWDISSISDTDADPHIDLTDEDEDEEEEDNTIGTSHLSQMSKIHSSCPLSLKTSLQLVAAFQTKYHLSDKVTGGILKLIKQHLPPIHSYPASSFQLRKLLTEDNICTKVYFCPSCKTVTSESFVCSSCNTSWEKAQLEKQHCFFVTLDIRHQINLLLKSRKVRRVLTTKFFEGHGLHSDNRCGEQLRKLKHDAFDVSCTFNSDGVQLFESSNSSIWPLLISINELPYRLRKQHILLGGIWFCGPKVDMDLFLRPIVKMMNDLYLNPVEWEAENGAKIFSRFLFPICAVDTPARCKMQGLIQFNGQFGCCWCHHPGKRVPKGQGFCRAYPLQGFKVTYRSNLEFKKKLMRKDYTCGIKRESPLNGLRNFDIVWGFSVDAMHCVMLGVVRNLCFLWIDDCSAPYHISLKDCDERLQQCLVPTDVSRTVRSLVVRKHWKASEWQTWLYISPVLLRGILKRKYLNHFKLLSEAVYTLSKKDLSETEIDLAEKRLLKFVKDVKTLYV